VANILIVDDNPGIRNWLVHILQEAGHEVLTAADGRIARIKADSLSLDLVITDLVMPGEDGLEMINRMHKEHPMVKIIAISGAFPALLAAAKLIGASATLTKPMEAEMVLRHVSELLQLQVPS
jgi:DNA-binding NtrC family response regulator